MRSANNASTRDAEWSATPAWHGARLPTPRPPWACRKAMLSCVPISRVVTGRLGGPVRKWTPAAWRGTRDGLDAATVAVMRGRWMLVQLRCRASRLSAFVSAVLVALSLVPAATTGDWGSGPSCRSGRRAVHVGPTLAVLASLRGGSEGNAQEESGQGEQQTSYAPLTPVAPSAVALQEELGRVTKQWVEGRGRRDAPSPERDLQEEIDNVIAKWTQTAIATPRIVVQEPRRHASSSATPVPSRPTPQGMGRLSDTDNVWFGEGGVSVRRGLTSPSPVYETASDGGDRGGEDEAGSAEGGRADTHDAAVDGAGQASQLMDDGQELSRESGDGERGDENSVASQHVRPGSPASSPVTAVGERQVPGGMDDQLVRSSAALQALSVQLQSRALVEMWVDPTGVDSERTHACTRHAHAHALTNTHNARTHTLLSLSLPLCSVPCLSFPHRGLAVRGSGAAALCHGTRFARNA